MSTRSKRVVTGPLQANVSMPSVRTASAVTATQTGPTNVAFGSRHAVALGSAPSFDPAANVVSIPTL